jgi:hypothetical protein
MKRTVSSNPIRLERSCHDIGADIPCPLRLGAHYFEIDSHLTGASCQCRRARRARVRSPIEHPAGSRASQRICRAEGRWRMGGVRRLASASVSTWASKAQLVYVGLILFRLAFESQGQSGRGAPPAFRPEGARKRGAFNGSGVENTIAISARYWSQPAHDEQAFGVDLYKLGVENRASAAVKAAQALQLRYEKGWRTGMRLGTCGLMPGRPSPRAEPGGFACVFFDKGSYASL